MTHLVPIQEMIYYLVTRSPNASFFITCVSAFYLYTISFIPTLLNALTEVFVLGWGDAADVSFDQKVEVWDDDEGWGQAGPWVVLHYQVVTLKLPVGVTALLYFGEGVAVDSKSKPHYACTDSYSAFLLWVSIMYNIKYNCSCFKSV